MLAVIADGRTVSEARRDIARVLAETHTPSIIVTHDQDEALSLANQVVILDDGHALAHGSPADLHRTPISAAAARYLGDANLLAGAVDAGVARCALGVVQVGADLPSGPAIILVRPEQLRASVAPTEGSVPETMGHIDYHGHDSLAELTLDDATMLTVRLTDTALVNGVGIRPGDRVCVQAVGDMVAWPRAIAWGPSGTRRPRAVTPNDFTFGQLGTIVSSCRIFI